MGYSRICGLTFVSWVVVLALWTGVRFPMTRESVGSCVQVSLHFRLRRLSHGDMCWKGDDMAVHYKRNCLETCVSISRSNLRFDGNSLPLQSACLE